MLEFLKRAAGLVIAPSVNRVVLFVDTDGFYKTKDQAGVVTVLGRGITNIVRTSGTGAAGTTDTYTITIDGGATYTFTVVNGANGSSVQVQDEGVTLTSVATNLNFVGPGVLATNTGGNVTVTINGGNAFGVVTGNTGTASADSAGDSLAVTGSNGISVAATDTPDGVVISPTYGVPVALSTANAEGGANTFARSDHVHLNPVIAHEAAGDPHPQYLTPTEASLAYSKIFWFDVTNFGISQGNSGAANVSAWNALYSTIPVNSTIYFPEGTYDFASELTLNRNVQIMIRGAGKSRTILRSTSTTANLFYLSISAYYYSFEEIGFNATVTKTAGAMIGTNPAAGDNAYLDIRRCEFKNYFLGIALDGVGAGNVGTISEVLMNTPVAGSIGLRINGENINMMVHNCTINQNPGPAGLGVCLQVLTSGAVQFTGCDFIGGLKTLEVNPTVSPVSALYFTNCFFDQAGSVGVDFIGTRATSRVKFVQCGITNGNVAGSIALRVAGTGTGINIPEALDFELCDFYNSFNGLSCTGISLSGFRGIDIKDCRVSGFTVGVDITPYSANATSNFNLQGNTIGPTENFPGNATGLRVNAGSFTFAAANISYNDLSGNTTQNYVGNGTYENGQLQLIGNLGLPFQPQPTAPNLLLTAAATAVRAGNAVPIPANSVRPGTAVRFTIQATNAATISTNTVTIRFGTANTNADAVIHTLALGAGTAAVGGATIVGTVTFLSATTIISSIQVFNNAAAGFTNAVAQSNTTTAPVTVSTSALGFMGLYISPSAANVVTIRSSNAEVINQ